MSYILIVIIFFINSVHSETAASVDEDSKSGFSLSRTQVVCIVLVFLLIVCIASIGALYFGFKSGQKSIEDEVETEENTGKGETKVVKFNQEMAPNPEYMTQNETTLHMKTDELNGEKLEKTKSLSSKSVETVRSVEVCEVLPKESLAQSPTGGKGPTSLNESSADKDQLDLENRSKNIDL